MKVFLSLGSNIGDRLIHLNKAALLLSNHIKIDIISKSKVYETSPMENKEQNFFLNQVIEIETFTKPLELLVKVSKVKIIRKRQNLKDLI